MKILFPIGSFYPAQRGGSNNSIYWIAKYLAKNQIGVTVVTKTTGINASHDIKSNNWLMLDGIKVIYTTNSFHQLPFRMLYKSVQEIKKNDIVFLTSVFYLPSIILAFFSILNHKKIIWSPRGELEDAALSYNSLLKRIRLRFIKWLSKSNIYFHSTSFSETYNIVNLLNTKKVFELPNYYELPEKQNVLLEDKFLFIGRLHSIKAIDNIIDALYLSKRFKSSNYSFIIVGNEDESGYKNKLKELVLKYNFENKIFFMRSIAGEQKNRLYASSKYLFLLSKSENFGNVVLESLAQGTPVIASKGTPWETLNEEKAGFWIENTPNEIAHTIDLVIEMENELYLKYRENSYKLVKNNYNIENKIDAWINKLNEII